ncbi:Protein RFT1-like protein [Bienertia sinuspersici]
MQPQSKNGSPPNFSRTFKYLLATQLLSRGIPFIFNTWMIRHLTAGDYALYAVQFHLLVTCILFLSREGFRRACMRAEIKSDDTSIEEYAAKILKVAWLSLPLGTLVTVIACAIIFWWQELSCYSPYGQAILLNGFACLLELLAEPFYILAQYLFCLKLRMVVESAATLSRCELRMPSLLGQVAWKRQLCFPCHKFHMELVCS